MKDDLSCLPALLSRRQAAYMLNMSLGKFDMLRREKRIRSVNIDGLVRFEKREIQAFIARHRSHRRLFDVSHLTQGEI